ncbi:nucleotidyl transferase AbiEii/AbiGii toxin family protein [Candidatus Falkowbacteria bacterium]|nr:nucleotidyl transferase AbiEii/AbiGii toxin family protein [Candidatus Falkowbacteria bacterium]
MSKRLDSWHLEILDDKRAEVLHRLKEFEQFGFLAGGTALALQIGHRRSYDFDVFCYSEIQLSLLSQCKKIFDIKQSLVNNSEEFTFLTKHNIKITFLYYPFVFRGHKIKKQGFLPMLSILDIASAKAYALNRRASFRDYVDLYFIIKNKHASLARIIKNCKRIYSELFSEKLLLGQLLYVEDLPQDEIKNLMFIERRISVGEIQRFFQKGIEKALG